MPRHRYKKDMEIAGKIKMMSAMGLSQAQAGSIVGISEDTIQRYYKEEWHEGKATANFKVAQTLYEKAIGGDTASLIFWCKTQMGWRETNRQEITANIKSDNKIQFSWLPSTDANKNLKPATTGSDATGTGSDAADNSDGNVDTNTSKE